ncbi:uncharacterized protein STEHIDRAFT_116769 [Stereum hirsutum FP-91666 SS1]|uniref:Uncharacterized protein n=1 Tax=Stereum hirsutum (strain FP-91666) TaxID=721885 RepID=R7RWK2_STEHR|nr:uncharacterized protein STEHIDRAFT_116769 [Stereum hirsutum FP-91666 SS1]EIM79143.1 hypothetical protein STEHIDRAFT_116769 [Stereum hirsutum FP-91666 SS1]
MSAPSSPPLTASSVTASLPPTTVLSDALSLPDEDSSSNSRKPALSIITEISEHDGSDTQRTIGIAFLRILAYQVLHHSRGQSKEYQKHVLIFYKSHVPVGLGSVRPIIKKLNPVGIGTGTPILRKTKKPLALPVLPFGPRVQFQCQCPLPPLTSVDRELPLCPGDPLRRLRTSLLRLSTHLPTRILPLAGDNFETVVDTLEEASFDNRDDVLEWLDVRKRELCR